MGKKTETIVVSLTPRQIKALWPLQELSHEANRKFKRGMILAQVWPEQGYMRACFLPPRKASRFVGSVETKKGKADK